MRWKKQFEGLARDRLEELAAQSLDQQSVVVDRCSELLEALREHRAALQQMVDADDLATFLAAQKSARELLKRTA